MVFAGLIVAVACMDSLEVLSLGTDSSEPPRRLLRRRLVHKPEAIVVLQQSSRAGLLYAIAVGGQNGLEIEMVMGPAMVRVDSGPFRRHDGHAVSAMASSSCGSFMAVTTLAGHIGIWQLELDQDGTYCPARLLLAPAVVCCMLHSACCMLQHCPHPARLPPLALWLEHPTPFSISFQ